MEVADFMDSGQPGFELIEGSSRHVRAKLALLCDKKF